MSITIQENVFDGFSGAGFGAIGLEKYFNVPIANDINKDACKSYSLNHKESKVLCKDIRDIDFLQGDYQGYVGSLQTPPCQSFADLNLKKDTNDERANLIYQFIRFLREAKPIWSIFENVFSITKEHKLRLIKEIESLGYKVVSKIINAWEYGSYQIRKRWIMIVHKTKHLFIEKIPLSLRKKAGDLLTGQTSEIIPRTETLEKIQLITRTGHWMPLIGQKFKVYFIIDPNKPFPAIVNPTKLRYVRPDKTGYLSMKELIAGFGVNPEEFQLVGTLSSQGQQLANGFPADLAERFAQLLYEKGSL